MRLLLQQPIVVELGERGETARITYAEVIINAAGTVGVVMLLAILIGVGIGGVIIYRKRRTEATAPVTESEHIRLRI